MPVEMNINLDWSDQKVVISYKITKNCIYLNMMLIAKFSNTLENKGILLIYNKDVHMNDHETVQYILFCYYKDFTKTNDCEI